VPNNGGAIGRLAPSICFQFGDERHQAVQFFEWLFLAHANVGDELREARPAFGEF